MGQISVEEQGQDDEQEGQVKRFDIFNTLHTAELRGVPLVIEIADQCKSVQAMADRDL